MLPSPSGMGLATLKKSFSKLNHPAHRCPCLRFNCHLAAAAARLRVRMDSLLLSCRALSSPTTCRFIPAHPRYGFEPRFTGLRPLFLFAELEVKPGGWSARLPVVSGPAFDRVNAFAF